MIQNQKSKKSSLLPQLQGREVANPPTADVLFSFDYFIGVLQRLVQVVEVAHVAAAQLPDERVRVALSFQDEAVEDEVAPQTILGIQTSSDLGTSTSTDAFSYVAGPSLSSETALLVPVTDSIFVDPDLLKVQDDVIAPPASGEGGNPPTAEVLYIFNYLIGVIKHLAQVVAVAHVTAASLPDVINAHLLVPHSLGGQKRTLIQPPVSGKKKRRKVHSSSLI